METHSFFWKKRIALVLSIVIVVGLSPIGSASLKPGVMAPDFTLKSAGGKNLKLSEFRGDVVMINFWATWCGPCRQEMPQLNELYSRYRKAGFHVLAVNVDNDAAKAAAMAKRLHISFPVLFDKGKKVSKLFNIDAMPSTLFIDRDGRVRYVHRGYRPGVEKKYQAHIRELLRE